LRGITYRLPKTPGSNWPRGRAMKDLTALRNALRDFARERDWDQVHSPKKAMALAG